MEELAYIKYGMEKPRETKVGFLICGTQKGGTRALDAYLREHPEVCMANQKEVHFFDRDNQFSNCNPDYPLYHSFFSPEPAHKVIGETTPIYMYWEPAPRRIWEYNPNMKLIVLLRNPLTRAFSHWNMETRRSREKLSFIGSIQNEYERCRESLPYQHRVYSYVDRGFYLEQLKRLMRFFPTEQILVIKSETLKTQPEESMLQVIEFLNICKFEVTEAKDEHSLQYDSNMSPSEKNYLLSVFTHGIREIEKFLGWDCSDWLT